MSLSSKLIEISIVLPTFNEKENIEKMIKEVFNEFQKNKINGEVVVVDDNSPDGTGNIAESLKKQYPKLEVIHRIKKEGLSSAVMSGFEKANGNILGVMDSDLSHPTDKIKELYHILKEDKADLVIGSRHVKGGKIEGWNSFRKIQSKTAIILSKPLTRVKDPMSGFFMIKKELISNKQINPKGFKILLEIIIKTKPNRIIEVPITFINRKQGRSKAGIKEIFYYLNNLSKYYFLK